MRPMIALLSLAMPCAAASFASIRDGNWTAPSTWTITSGSDADGIPDGDDLVSIGHVVDVNSRVEAGAVTVGSSGRLRLAAASSLTLRSSLSFSWVYGVIEGPSSGSASIGAPSRMVHLTVAPSGFVRGALDLSVSLTNDGTVEVIGDYTLRLSGNAKNGSGTWRVASTAGKLVVESLVSGASSWRLESGRIENRRGQAALSGSVVIEAGILHCYETFRTTGPLTWKGGQIVVEPQRAAAFGQVPDA